MVSADSNYQTRLKHNEINLHICTPLELASVEVSRVGETEFGHLCRQLAAYYWHQDQERDYICSRPEDSGMHRCEDLPPSQLGRQLCTASALPWSPNIPTNSSCVNWNQYYTDCKPPGSNPFQGTISFDNIGLAWVAIFLVSISIEILNLLHLKLFQKYISLKNITNTTVILYNLLSR